jgi:hypothetical protein
LSTPDAHKADGVPPFPQLKEFVMNDKSQTELQPELQVVDLGDAKVVTQGIPALVHAEDNPQVLARK